MLKQISVAWVPCYLDPAVVASARLRAWHPGLELQRRGYCRSTMITSWDEFVRFFSSPVANKIMVYQRTYSGEFFDVSVRMCKKARIPVVMDLCDVYPEATDAVNLFASLLSTATQPRVDDWLGEGVKVPIEIVGDMPDYGGELVKNDISGSEDLKPVWFGTYSNIDLVKYLSTFIDGTALSDPQIKGEIPSSWKFKKWCFDSFKCDMGEFNLCLLPQTDTGKSVNKFLTALSCGLPVVASAIPSYVEVAEPLGVDDFLCKTMNTDEWMSKIDSMRSYNVRENYMEKIKTGYKKYCSGDTVLEQWMHLLREVLK